MFNWQDQKRLEEAAATVLGRILWEIGSLEASLGTVLAWARGGDHLVSMSATVDPLSFDKRLKLLEAVVAEQAQPAAIVALYGQWIGDAHALRLRRNSLIHGRWAVTGDGRIANVVGLMTKPDQVETRYSLQELEAVLEDIKAIHQRLRQLHTRHRLGP